MAKLRRSEWPSLGGVNGQARRFMPDIRKETETETKPNPKPKLTQQSNPGSILKSLNELPINNHGVTKKHRVTNKYDGVTNTCWSYL